MIRAWVGLVLLAALPATASDWPSAVPPQAGARAPGDPGAKPDAKTDGWQLISEADGIRVFKREAAGTSLLAFRGEGLVRAPIARVARVVIDNDLGPDWVDDLKESYTLKPLGPRSHIEYNRVAGVPIVVSDRDFVTHVTITDLPKKERLVVRFKSADAEFAKKTTCCVRGKFLMSTFDLTAVPDGPGPKATYFIGEILVDPMGSVPKWLVNMFQRGWARDTLEGVRKEADKTNLPAPKEYADLYKELEGWK